MRFVGKLYRHYAIEGRTNMLTTDPLFLTMKRSDKGPNTFSQTIKDLEPGRLYSFEMYVCDYNDLRAPKPKKPAETRAVASVVIDGADMDRARSFAETYASNPEPETPVCITYYWKVFRAKGTSATLTVSDWPESGQPAAPFGQEQAFNFIEIQPYHE